MRGDSSCAAASRRAWRRLIHGLVDNFYFLIDLAFIWWFLLALAAIASDEAVPRAGAHDRPGTQGAANQRAIARRAAASIRSAIGGEGQGR